MSDVNPFEQPPLVEWENCITYTELIGTVEKFQESLNETPKWKFIERYRIEVTIRALHGLIVYLKSKPFITFGLPQ